MMNPMQNEFKEDIPNPSGQPKRKNGPTSNGPSVFTRLMNSLINMGLGEPLIKLGVNLFSVMAPSPISVLAGKKKEAGRNDYYAYDSCTAMSYGITSLALGKLYWAENLSALLEDQSRVYFNEALAKGNLYGTDSLVYKKTVFNGNSEGRELLLKSMLNNTYSRLRILQIGRAHV